MVMHEVIHTPVIRPMKWRELVQIARQIPRVSTNPATFAAAGISVTLDKNERYCNHD